MDLRKIEFTNDRIVDELFRQYAERICELLASSGLDTHPYSSSELSLFRSLSFEARQSTLRYVKIYLDSLEDSVSSGADHRNNARALWSAIKVMGFRHPAELFSTLEDDDMIEVYSPEGIQIWRNFNVMSICSYTIEEMYCLTWEERYQREPSITQDILSKVAETLSSRQGRVLSLPVGDHTVTERRSHRRYVLQARHDRFSPLFDEAGQTAAFIVTSKVRVVQSLAESYPELVSQTLPDHLGSRHLTVVN